jgi:hypothetical protein
LSDLLGRAEQARAGGCEVMGAARLRRCTAVAYHTESAKAGEGDRPKAGACTPEARSWGCARAAGARQRGGIAQASRLRRAVLRSADSVAKRGLTFELTPTVEAGAVRRGTENVHRTCGPPYSACRSGSGLSEGLGRTVLNGEACFRKCDAQDARLCACALIAEHRETMHALQELISVHWYWQIAPIRDISVPTRGHNGTPQDGSIRGAQVFRRAFEPPHAYNWVDESLRRQHGADVEQGSFSEEQLSHVMIVLRSCLKRSPAAHLGATDRTHFDREAAAVLACAA